MHAKSLVSVEPKFLKATQAMTRYSLSRNTLNRAAAEAGAIVRYGRSVLYDREKLDSYFDALAVR